MYHELVRALQKQVLDYVRRHDLIHPGDRVGVAVSGGADSVALLRLLLDLRKELGIVLYVVHVNHQLRGPESDEDFAFVLRLAARFGLESGSWTVDVRDLARSMQLSVEAVGRRVRYDSFYDFVRKGVMDRIATGHTLDDQAETVLMRLARGAGTRGLAGIYPQMTYRPRGISEEHKPARIIRPLLEVRRQSLRDYLTEIGQDWREDPSNRDLSYARNRVRHEILPALERNLNPEVQRTLAETAEIARAEQEFWDHEVARVLPAVWKLDPDSHNQSLEIAALLSFPLALRRRVLRAIAEELGLRLEFQHVESVLELSEKVGANRCTALPDEWQAVRDRNRLCFQRAPQDIGTGYEYLLPVPGRIHVTELGAAFETQLVSGTEGGSSPDQLLDARLLGKQLRIRNWRDGDRFWPAHTRGPKKLKELLQIKHISGRQRQLWPVVASDSELVWVRGFPTPSHLQPHADSAHAVLICESEIGDVPGPSRGGIS